MLLDVFSSGHLRPKIQIPAFDSPDARAAAAADGLWSAPEVLVGGLHTPASELYAFALILCYMFSQREPFAEEAARLSLRRLPQLLALIAHNDLRPRLPAAMPEPLRELICGFWARNPLHRPPWALAAERLFAALAASKPAPPAVEDRCIVEDVLPPHVLKVLRAGGVSESEYFKEVTVMFVDVVGFTTISSKLPADKVSDMLSRLFAKLDLIVEDLDLFKVEASAPARNRRRPSLRRSDCLIAADRTLWSYRQ